MKKPDFWPEHINFAKAPINWSLKAAQFRNASKVLYKAYKKAQQYEPEPGTKITDEKYQKATEGKGTKLPIIVNIGYAIELILKAIIIQNDHSVIPKMVR